MKRALAVVAALAVGLMQAHADTPPILLRMQNAADTLNYRGVLVQIQGNHTQTLRLLHRAGANGGDDRVNSLQGRYWEMRRSGNTCRVALSAARSAREEALVAAVFPSLLPSRLQRLAAFYDFAPIGSGRIADRAADFTVARPRDEYRFPYLLVTDAATGLLLKVSLLDNGGRELRQAFFVDLELLDDIPEAEWERTPAMAPATQQWRDYRLGQRAKDNTSPWRIDSLPPGFAVRGYGRERLPGSDQDVEQLTVSDGLATISVFIDRMTEGDKSLQGAGHVEALPAYGTTVDGRHVTLLGAVPTVSLEHIAKSLTLAPVAAPVTLAPPVSLSPVKDP